MNEHWTDKLIDAHLQELNDIEPSLGFESRLLARVGARRNPPRTVASWVWSAAMLSALAVGLFLMGRPEQKAAPTRTINTAIPPGTEVSAPAPPKSEVARQVARRPWNAGRKVIQPADWRPDIFPSPAPLSEQEKLALAYLRVTPRSEVIAMSQPELLFDEINENLRHDVDPLRNTR